MTKEPSSDLSRSVEDYLKTIFTLSEAGQPASTTGIADALAVAAPSVSGMVKRLAETGLVEHFPYKGVTLTDDGRRAALRMLRRHRLIEAYLVQCLDYSWDTVHDEAERLEHAVSDDLIDRMARALGHPSVDPHGDPIPTVDGAMPENFDVSLPDVAVGETVTIARVDSSSAERLRWLADAGLVPGVEVTVCDVQPFAGPITVDLGGEQRVVGRELARQLRCARRVRDGGGA
ncbi:MAG: metal-dependent transcriptional regulator [Gemmatimonadota bacterium]